MLYCLIPLISLGLVGCAGPKSSYDWGGYQPAIITYYKNNDASGFEAKIKEALTKSEASKKVPPGLHAELGYLLFERGDLAGAGQHFAREKELFPESSLLMDKMLTGIEAASKKGGTQ